MITVDKLAAEVITQKDLYRALLNENIGEVFDEIADEGLNEIKSRSQTAGFNDRKYSKSWDKRIVKNPSTGMYNVTIYNKKHYRLTHLLEKGHALKNGGRTRAFPHIAPTQDHMDKRIVEEITKAIEETR